MISFTHAEILSSCIWAVMYGLFYCVLYCISVSLTNLLSCLPGDIKSMLGFERIFPLPKFKHEKTKSIGSLLIIILVFLYGLGFSLISYAALDGEIRLYMLVLSFASFYLSKNVFFNFEQSTIRLIYVALLKIISLLIRLLVVLKRRIVFVFRKIITHKNDKINNII